MASASRKGNVMEHHGTTLDEFVTGYVLAARWTSDEVSDTDEIAPEALASIRKDCTQFLETNLADIETYEDEIGVWHGNDTVRGNDAAYTALESAGGDFWLSRNHHGSGFFERELGALGDRLQTAAQSCGESDLYSGDDGLIYVFPS